MDESDEDLGLAIDEDNSNIDDEELDENSEEGEEVLIGGKTKEQTKVVVLHPGSSKLYYGFGSDVLPKSIPHVVAFPRSQEEAKNHTLKVLEKKTTTQADDEAAQKLESSLESVRSAFDWINGDSSNAYTSNSSSKKKSSRKQSSVLSKRKREEVPLSAMWTGLPMADDFGSLTEPLEQQPPDKILIGMDAIHASLEEQLGSGRSYSLIWPFRAGRFNPSLSLQVVISALTCIWKGAIEKLGVPSEEIKDRSIVLVIPDVFDQRELKVMIDIILVHLGCSSVLIVQESVSATFGAGVSTACVVDIGELKTSITCVEDGHSIKQTRVCMPVGGRDVSRCLVRHLQHYFEVGASFSQPKLPAQLACLHTNFGYPWVRMALDDLKEKRCHLSVVEADMPKVGRIAVHGIAETPVCLVIEASEPFVTAPLVIFFPDLMEGKRPTRRPPFCRKQFSLPEEPEDMIDDEKFMVEVLKTMKPSAAQEPDFIKAMPLDKAVLKSLHRIDKTKKDALAKLFANIVLVGGCSMIPGIHKLLEDRIFDDLPQEFDVQKVDVLHGRSRVPGSMVSWKGASVASHVASVRNCWVNQTEWRKYGLKIVREKAMLGI